MIKNSWLLAGSLLRKLVDGKRKWYYRQWPCSVNESYSLLVKRHYFMNQPKKGTKKGKEKDSFLLRFLLFLFFLPFFVLFVIYCSIFVPFFLVIFSLYFRWFKKQGECPFPYFSGNRILLSGAKRTALQVGWSQVARDGTEGVQKTKLSITRSIFELEARNYACK